MVQKSIGHLEIYRELGSRSPSARAQLRPSALRPGFELSFAGPKEKRRPKSQYISTTVYRRQRSCLPAFGVQAANLYPESGQAGPRTELGPRRGRAIEGHQRQFKTI